MTDQETYLLCPVFECTYEQWVSPEDQDASFSELWNHVLWKHTKVDQDATSKLMVNAKEVKR